MNKTIFKDFSKYVSFNILGQIAYSCYTPVSYTHLDVYKRQSKYSAN